MVFIQLSTLYTNLNSGRIVIRGYGNILEQRGNSERISRYGYKPSCLPTLTNPWSSPLTHESMSSEPLKFTNNVQACWCSLYVTRLSLDTPTDDSCKLFYEKGIHLAICWTLSYLSRYSESAECEQVSHCVSMQGSEVGTNINQHHHNVEMIKMDSTNFVTWGRKNRFPFTNMSVYRICSQSTLPPYL